MKPFIKEAIILVLIGASIIGALLTATSYLGVYETHWYEGSHLVCKVTKERGFGAKVEKTCYIIEKIK